jgi:hypothetical protein
MKKLFICMLAVMMMMPAAYADKKDKNKKGTPTTTAPAAPQTAIIKEGLFTVAKNKTDWFIEIPDSILGRLIQTVTRYVSTPVGAEVYGGEMVNTQTIYFEKNNDKILLRTLILGATTDKNSDIEKAVKISSEDPIVASFKIESSANKRYRINITRLFTDETQIFSIPGKKKKSMNLGGVLSDRSYITSIHTYPINTEFRAVKSYSYFASSGGGLLSLPSSSGLMSGEETGVATFSFNTSFVLLPKEPMRRRLADPRVGYFSDQYTYYSDDQQHVDTKEFITRWRLEPKPEDVEKMKRGELVEPIKPIVYYIDPATPKQWRKYLIAGVNDWQKAFEQAGFKNAIMAKEWPENDSTMSMEDARYSVIRYLASPIENAYGPQVHDPRSGEIIESHICWYHNVMTVVHDWYMVQAGCIDKRAQKMKYDEDLMGDLIRFVSSHEVGHTLGLRHNMGSSSTVPVEKLRDKAWVEANGHTPSIMDYARFNYVAQPEDNITKAGIYPRIGDYDKWAIEWGYKPCLNGETEDQDHLNSNKEIIKRVKANPRLYFGTYEPISGFTFNTDDPRCQSEDLGDNAMKASEYGIKNLKREIKLLPQWTYEEGDMNKNLKRMYYNIFSQMKRYMGHVITNIGGIYRNFLSADQEGKGYVAVSKATQLSALNFINKNIFIEPTWLTSESYINRFESDPQIFSRALAKQAVGSLTSGSRLNKMVELENADPANYKAQDYFNDLTKMVFSELYGKAGKISSYRRALQQQFVKYALSQATDKGLMETDAHTIISRQLLNLRQKALAASATATDGMTKAHLSDIALRIQKELLPNK